MSDPVPVSAVLSTGPAIIGRPSSGLGPSKELTTAEALDLLELVMADAPTTEPVASGVLWRNSGVVTLSVGIPPAFTDQPDSTTVNEGSTATFTVAATNANTYQWQKQEGGTGSWANISGATSTSYTTGTLTNSADNADAYRCVATGDGGATNSSTATLTVLPPAPLTGLTATVAISPMYLVPAWQAGSQPTVRVEKGFGSGVFADLYPHTDGKLYTATNGGGQEASVYAGGSKLLVETPYNQCLASKDASGHPTAVTSNTRRVLLDVSVTNAPRFAGIAQGTQDASQSLTERGYDLNVNVTTNTGVTFLSFDALPSSGTTDYRSYQNNGGSTLNVFVNPGNNRWYPNEVTVASLNPLRMPAIKCVLADQDGSASTSDLVHSIAGGASHANGSRTVAATSTPMRIWGPTSPLTGACYAFVMFSGSYQTISNFQPTGTLIPRLHKAAANVYGANELTLYSPIQNQGFKLTSYSPAQGAIEIVCASAPLRAIEASFNGGAYATIGTTDANGFLVGSLTGLSSADGTLNVRVVGQASVAATVSNVRVGFAVNPLGQSNADGRGDDITLTATRSIASNGWANSTATQKSWIWALLQNRATALSCPVIKGGRSAGATYLYYNALGSSDGRHGHWNPNNPGTSTTDNFAEAVAYAHTQRTEPNFCIWHQGEEDANGGVTKANYKQALVDMWTEFRARTGWTNKLWVMVIGRDGVVADNNVNQIRYAQIEAVNENPSLFEMGGCLAHLPVGDGTTDFVHFWTQAQKDAVVAVFLRHAFGSGRAHRYSSGSKGSTTANLTFTGGSGNLTVGASPTLGWTCTDGSGSITVTDCTASGSQLTLTFNRAISGSLLVKWCSHYSGVGATIADSDATTPLPPEPFEVTL